MPYPAIWEHLQPDVEVHEDGENGHFNYILLTSNKILCKTTYMLIIHWQQLHVTLKDEWIKIMKHSSGKTNM